MSLIEELCRSGWENAAFAVVSADRETLAKLVAHSAQVPTSTAMATAWGTRGLSLT